MMGLDPCTESVDSSSGDEATEGPFGDEVLDRCMAGVDLDAIRARAAARSGSWISLVRRERREVRSGLESTRWNSCWSFTLGSGLSFGESSQSESSSSSSMALSDTSSSDSKTSSSSCTRWLMVRDSTSSLNDVCFLWLFGFARFAVSELCGCWLDMRSSKELSSSPEEPPMKKAPPFLESSGLWIIDFAATAAAARFVCER